MAVYRLLAVGALFCAAPLIVASARQAEGRIYVLHSGPTNGCPSLDWHIVAEPSGTLSGMISWNDMKTMARAVGTLDREHHTFTITATELGRGGQTAKIEGLVKENGWLIANIKAPRVACKAIAVPIYIRPPDAE